MGRRHNYRRRKVHRPKHSASVQAYIEKAKYIIAMRSVKAHEPRPSLWLREQERLDTCERRGYRHRYGRNW